MKFKRAMVKVSKYFHIVQPNGNLVMVRIKEPLTSSVGMTSRIFSYQKDCNVPSVSKYNKFIACR